MRHKLHVDHTTSEHASWQQQCHPQWIANTKHHTERQKVRNNVLAGYVLVKLWCAHQISWQMTKIQPIKDVWCCCHNGNRQCWPFALSTSQFSIRILIEKLARTLLSRNHHLYSWANENYTTQGFVRTEKPINIINSFVMMLFNVFI